MKSELNWLNIDTAWLSIPNYGEISEHAVSPSVIQHPLRCCVCSYVISILWAPVSILAHKSSSLPSSFERYSGSLFGAVVTFLCTDIFCHVQIHFVPKICSQPCLAQLPIIPADVRFMSRETRDSIELQPWRFFWRLFLPPPTLTAALRE